MLITQNTVNAPKKAFPKNTQAATPQPKPPVDTVESSNQEKREFTWGDYFDLNKSQPEEVTHGFQIGAGLGALSFGLFAFAGLPVMGAVAGIAFVVAGIQDGITNANHS